MNFTKNNIHLKFDNNCGQRSSDINERWKHLESRVPLLTGYLFLLGKVSIGIQVCCCFGWGRSALVFRFVVVFVVVFVAVFVGLISGDNLNFISQIVKLIKE